MRWLCAALAALFAYTTCTPHQHSYPEGIRRATINQQEGGSP